MSTIGIVVTGSKGNGGVYQYAQSLIDALIIDKTNNYVIFTNADDTRFDKYDAEIRKLSNTTNPLLVLLRFLTIVLNIKRFSLLPKVEQDLFNDIDLLIYPSISIRSHTILGLPFVYTLHDLQERYYPDFFTFPERVVRYFVTKRISKMSNHIICESHYVKRDISKFLDIDSSKISVVTAPPIAVFTNATINDDISEIVKKKYNLSERYLFYPAQFWAHKNHVKLLEAFKMLCNNDEDISLVLTGSMDSGFAKIQKEIESLQLDERVNILGYIDYSDLVYLYAGASLLVMPTLFESVSIPIYEAFAMKVPVVCSDVVALPEQIQNAGLTFNPNSAEDIYLKIDKMLSSKELQMQCINEGHKIISSFDLEGYRNKLLSIINFVKIS